MENVWLYYKCIGVSDYIILVNTHTKNTSILEEQWKQPKLKTASEIEVKSIGL